MYRGNSGSGFLGDTVDEKLREGKAGRWVWERGLASSLHIAFPTPNCLEMGTTQGAVSRRSGLMFGHWAGRKMHSGPPVALASPSPPASAQRHPPRAKWLCALEAGSSSSGGPRRLQLGGWERRRRALTGAVQRGGGLNRLAQRLVCCAVNRWGSETAAGTSL